jgi:hypothetical protein
MKIRDQQQVRVSARKEYLLSKSLHLQQGMLSFSSLFNDFQVIQLILLFLDVLYRNMTPYNRPPSLYELPTTSH